ncbi:MAG: type 1 glutamine amidotransferase [Endozoicomonas sp.]
MNHCPLSSVAIIDCGSSKTPNIREMVTDHNESPVTISWKQANDYDFGNCKAMIISGGPHLFTDSEAKQQELMRHFLFLKHLQTPTLGICLGHQAIALTFGGEVYRGPERRKQDEITTALEHPLFSNLPDDALFAEDHCEGISPSGVMTVLASSEHYAVEALEISDRPFLGVQFHPEVSGNNGSILIGNFLNWANQNTSQ